MSDPMINRSDITRGPITFRAMQYQCHQEARANGWWDDDMGERTPGDLAATMHSEVTEFFEHTRNGHAINESWVAPSGFPDGPAVELADLVIRVLDTAQAYEIDLYSLILDKLAYNRTRGHRHGGKAV